MLIDLTATLTPDTPGVSWETAKDLARDGWNARTLHLYSHSGTHMDAPKHFGCTHPIGDTIDQLSLDTFLGPAHVIHLNPDPSELLTPSHLGTLAITFPVGHALLLHTGWSQHRANPELFRNQLPRISEDLAHWCVDHQVRVLGVEPPSVADVNNLPEVSNIHKILLSGGVTIVEGLVNLHQLPENQVFHLITLPMKVSYGDGAPCRAIAEV